MGKETIIIYSIGSILIWLYLLILHLNVRKDIKRHRKLVEEYNKKYSNEETLRDAALIDYKRDFNEDYMNLLLKLKEGVREQPKRKK